MLAQITDKKIEEREYKKKHIDSHRNKTRIVSLGPEHLFSVY